MTMQTMNYEHVLQVIEDNSSLSEKSKIRSQVQGQYSGLKYKLYVWTSPCPGDLWSATTI